MPCRWSLHHTSIALVCLAQQNALLVKHSGLLLTIPWATSRALLASARAASARCERLFAASF